MNGDDPDLIPPGALRGVTVGLSVSDSADLFRLGLDEQHINLAVGEITRAILIAGGTIAYGGWLRPSGFTHQLMDEVRRFGVARHSLTLYVALPEHRDLGRDVLDNVDRQLGTWGKLTTLDIHGDPVDWRTLPQSAVPLADDDRVAAYSGLRRHMADRIDGRVLVGGKLRGYVGAIPGVIEEALLAVERSQPIYLAGGFGGAAAAVARRLHAGDLTWLPPGLPDGEDEPGAQGALRRLESLVSESGWKVSNDGLTSERRAQLSASHRPGEIASLCVVGLAVRFSRQEGKD
jgi:hypothetical protein